MVTECAESNVLRRRTDLGDGQATRSQGGRLLLDRLVRRLRPSQSGPTGWEKWLQHLRAIMGKNRQGDRVADGRQNGSRHVLLASAGSARSLERTEIEGSVRRFESNHYAIAAQSLRFKSHSITHIGNRHTIGTLDNGAGNEPHSQLDQLDRAERPRNGLHSRTRAGEHLFGRVHGFIA